MPLVVPGINSKGDSESQNTTNPVIPNEEQVKSGVFDKPKSGLANALAEHHTAAPGPVIPQDTSVFEKKPSREEQLARAKELNGE